MDGLISATFKIIGCVVGSVFIVPFPSKKYHAFKYSKFFFDASTRQRLCFSH